MLLYLWCLVCIFGFIQRAISAAANLMYSACITHRHCTIVTIDLSLTQRFALHYDPPWIYRFVVLRHYYFCFDSLSCRLGVAGIQKYWIEFKLFLEIKRDDSCPFSYGDLPFIGSCSHWGVFTALICDLLRKSGLTGWPLLGLMFDERWRRRLSKRLSAPTRGRCRWHIRK